MALVLDGEGSISGFNIISVDSAFDIGTVKIRDSSGAASFKDSDGNSIAIKSSSINTGGITAGSVTATDLSVGNITTTGYVRGPSTFTIDPSEHDSSTGTLRVRGNLTVDGTTTTINSTTVTTADKNIVIAQGAVDSAAADGAGITIDTVNASLTYSHNDSDWKFNRGLEITSGDLHVSELNSQITQGPSLNASVHTGMGIKASTPRFTMEPTGDVQTSRIQFAKTDGTMWGSIFAYNTGEQLQYSAATHKFKTASTERMRIDSDGNVGIGGAPSSFGAGVATLQLKGLSGSQATRAGALRFISNDGTSCDTAIYSDNGFMSFYTGTSSAQILSMRLDAVGRLTIGTTSVYNSYADNLVVEDDSNAGITVATTDTSARTSLYFADGTSGTNQYKGIIEYRHASDSMHFWTGGTDHSIVISSTGEVGIGTSSPASHGYFAVDRGAVLGSDRTIAAFMAESTRKMGLVWDDSQSTLGLANLTSHDLCFHIGGIGGNSEKMRLDTAGTLGIAVTPNSMHSSYDGIQVQNNLWFTNNSNFSGFTQNSYYDTGGYKYATSGGASAIRQISGGFDFLVAPSGTADAALTWDIPMKILNSGRVYINDGDGVLLNGFGAESAAGMNIYPDAGFIAINADTSNTALYISKTSTATGNYINFATNGTNRGAIVEEGANIGIRFGATDTSAHTLDDYEEGTWTPVFGRMSSNPSVTYSSQTGAYTKVGNLVYASFDCNATSISGGSGQARISGLPFTVSNSNSTFAGYSVAQWRDCGAINAGGGAQEQLKGFAQRNSTYIYIQTDYSGYNGFSSTGASIGYQSSGRITGYIMYVAA